MSLSNVSRDLTKLEEEQLILRVKRGVWAITGHPDLSPFAVVPHLFDTEGKGYVSLLSALNLHGMIDQIPRVVHIVTTTQRVRLKTPLGTYEFSRINPKLFGGFGPYRGLGNFDIASPEKALFDILYLSVRKGRRFSYLPEVELPSKFSSAELESWISRVDHVPLRLSITVRWQKLAAKVESRQAR
jgi:hypothetical protein